MNIQKGDVLFVWGSGFIQEAIEKITSGPAHCAIFVDEKTVAEANGGRKTGTSNLSDYLNDKNVSRLEVWSDGTLTEQERESMVKFAEQHYGLSYDYPLIIGEMMQFEFNLDIDNWKEGTRLICSTYVNECARSIQHMWTTRKLPAPSDLLFGKILKRKVVLKNESTERS